jgi:biopolymer transport protein ExbD
MSILKDIIEDECELQMTPMIDVTFLLLIFFLCTIKFKTLEGKLAAYLPKDIGVNTMQAEKKEKVEIVIKVAEAGVKVDPRDPSVPWSGKGRYAWSGRQMRYSIGPFTTMDIDKLRERLTKLYQQDPERDSTIDPRQGVVYGDVVGVLDAAIEANYRSITFVGSYED